MKPISRLVLLLLVGASALAGVGVPSARGCLWDRDTLRTEGAAFPGIAEVLTGRFVREPARYYEIRLERVAGELKVDPSNLGNYDDAGVACDRLGRSDEAIGWMERKAAALERSEASSSVKDHPYRLHANLGTFYAHRWIRSGARRDELSDLRQAEREIARAIEINPDAHFGREKYQLAAIRWLIELPPGYPQPTFLELDMLEASPVDAVNGLAGLVVLGNAWESVDVYWALGAALNHHGDASLVLLAQLRLQELAAAGRKSLHPDFDGTDVWMKVAGSRFAGEPVEEDAVRSYYKEARQAADTWTADRTAFMEARFAEGKHPDTHPDFWSGWVEREPPPLPTSSDSMTTVAIAIVTAGVGVGAGGWYIRRSRRNAARVAGCRG